MFFQGLIALFFLALNNIDILGINELKWTGMGGFNSDDRYILWAGIP